MHGNQHAGLVWKMRDKQNFRSILQVGLVEFQEISGLSHGLADMNGLLFVYWDEFSLILESLLCVLLLSFVLPFQCSGCSDGL